MAGLVNLSRSIEENRGPTVNRIIIPLAILATVAVIARFYTRNLKGKRFAEDDYTIFCALVLNWGTCAVVICRDITGAAVWASVEPSVGVTCACIPILRPLLDLVVFDPVRRTSKTVRAAQKGSISGGNASGPARKDTNAKNFRRLNEPVMDWPDTGLCNTTAVGESLHYDEDAFTMDTILVRHDVDVSRDYPK
ncbi:MAG: hypothetical protein Q9161_008482 [Pseudevernia consocians]